MFEIEDIGIICGFVGALWCSFTPMFSSVDVINSCQLQWAEGKWYQKYLRTTLEDYIYNKKYHVRIGLIHMLVGTIIVLMY